MTDAEMEKEWNLGSSQEDLDLASFMDKKESELEDQELALFMDRVLLNDGSKSTDLNGKEYQGPCVNQLVLGPAKDTDQPGTSAEQKKVESPLQALKKGHFNGTIVWEDLDQEESCLLDMTGVCDETPETSQSLQSNNTDTVIDHKLIMEN